MAAKNPWEMSTLQFINTYYKPEDEEEEKARKQAEAAMKAAEEIKNLSNIKEPALIRSDEQKKTGTSTGGGTTMDWNQTDQSWRNSATVNDWVDLSSELKKKGYGTELADTVAVEAMPSEYPFRRELELRKETFTEEDVASKEADIVRNPYLQGLVEFGRGALSAAKSAMSGVSWLESKVPGIDALSNLISGKTATQRTAELTQETTYDRFKNAGYQTWSESVGELVSEAEIGMAGGSGISGGMKAVTGGRWTSEGLLQNVAEGVVQEAIDTSSRTAAGVQGYKWEDLPMNILLSASMDTGLYGLGKAFSRGSRSASFASQDPEFQNAVKRLLKSAQEAETSGDEVLMESVRKDAQALVLRAQSYSPEDLLSIPTSGNKAFDPELAPGKDASVSERASYYDSLGRDGKKAYAKTMKPEDVGAMNDELLNRKLEYETTSGWLAKKTDSRMADEEDVANAKAQAIDLMGKKLKRIDFDENTGDKLYLFDGVDKHVPARTAKELGLNVDEDGVPVGTYFSTKSKAWQANLRLQQIAKEEGAATSLVERSAVPVFNDLINFTNSKMVGAAKKAGTLDELAETGYTKARGAGAASDARDDMTKWVRNKLANNEVITRVDIVGKAVEIAKKRGLNFKPKTVEETWRDLPQDALETLQGSFGDASIQARRNLDKAKEMVDWRKANTTRKLVESGEYDPEKALTDWSQEFKAEGIDPTLTFGNKKEQVVAKFRALEEARTPVMRNPSKWRLEKAAQDVSLLAKTDAQARKEIVAEGKKLMDDLDATHRKAMDESRKKLEALLALERSPLMKPDMKAQAKAAKASENGAVAKERLTQSMKRKMAIDELKEIIRQQRKAFAEEKAFILDEWRKKLQINGAFASPSKQAKGVYDANMNISLSKLKVLLPPDEFSKLVMYSKTLSPNSPEKVVEAMSKVIDRGVRKAQSIWIARAEKAIEDAKSNVVPRKSLAAATALADQLAVFKRTGDVAAIADKVAEIEGFLKGAKEEAKGLKADLVQGINDDAKTAISEVDAKMMDNRILSKLKRGVLRVLDLTGTYDDAMRDVLPPSGMKYVDKANDADLRFRNKEHLYESIYYDSAKGVDDYGKTEVGIAANMEANPHLREDIINSPHIVFDRKKGRLVQIINARVSHSRNPRYDSVITGKMIDDAVARVNANKAEATMKATFLDIINNPEVFAKADDSFFAITGSRMGKVEGKYLPIMRMGKVKSEAEALEDALERNKLMEEGFDQNAIRQQFTKSRQEGASGTVNVNPDSIMRSWLDTNLRYSEMATEMYRLARFKDSFAKGVTEKVGDVSFSSPQGDRGVVKLLSGKLERLARGTSEKVSDNPNIALANKVISEIDSFMTVKALGTNATSAFIQPAQLLSALGIKGVDVGEAYKMSGKILLGGHFDEIYDASPAIRARTGAGETVMRSRLESGVTTFEKLMRGKEKVSEVLMKMITWSDSHVSSGLWANQYKRSMESAGKSWDVGQRIDMYSPEGVRAIQEADAMVRRVMGTGEKAHRAALFDSPSGRMIFFLGKSAATNLSTVIRQMVNSGSIPRSAGIALGYGSMLLTISAMRSAIGIIKEVIGGASDYQKEENEKVRKAFQEGVEAVLKQWIENTKGEVQLPGFSAGKFGGRELGLSQVTKDIHSGMKDASTILESGFSGDELLKYLFAIGAIVKTSVAPGDMKTFLNIAISPAKERGKLAKSLKEKGTGLDVSSMTTKQADEEIASRKENYTKLQEAKSSWGKFLKERQDAGKWYSDPANKFAELEAWQRSEVARTGNVPTNEQWASLKRKYVNYAKQYGNEDSVVGSLDPKTAVRYLSDKYGGGKFTMDAARKAQELHKLGLLTDQDAKDMIKYAKNMK